MKKTIKLIGIAVLVTAIVFGMAACNDGSTPSGKPALTGTVSISGTAEVGETLTAVTTALGGKGTIAYQWKRGTTNVGTNSSTYEVQAADKGSTITVTVTRTGYSGSKTSGATATVTDPTLPPLTGTVTITGTAAVGQTLTVVTTALDGNGTVTYEWKRTKDGTTTDIGTNSDTYVVQAADEGFAITVTVTRSGFSSSKTSEPTATVSIGTLSETVTVTFTPDTETVCVDTELTANYSGSETVSFQWKKDGSNVGTATTTNPNKYTPDEAGSYTVTISATGYNPKTSTAVSVSEHDYQNWTEATAPTCTTAGVEAGTCSYNETHTTTRPITALGHDLEWVTTATFISGGVSTGTCKHDPSHIETENVDPLPITSTEDWSAARSQIAGKGNAGTYTLTIKGDVGVVGSTALSFGTTATDTLKVTLKGTGKLYLTSPGNLICIGQRQTLIIDSEDLTLQGLTNGVDEATQDNNAPVVYVDSYGLLELENGTVSGNTSNSSGGGVYLPPNGRFTMNGGKISGNTISGSLSEGGGVCLGGSGGNFGATFTMNGGEISGNKAAGSSGGGVSMRNFGTFTMEGGEISGNTSGSTGGGVYVRESTFTMKGGEISNNTPFSYGGGVYVGGPGTTSFTMSGGKISGNTRGSGVYVTSPYGTKTSSFRMSGGEISGNTGTSGGGVYVYSSTFTMDEGKISHNTGTNGQGGGGVWVMQDGIFTMNGGEISNNTFDRDGQNGGGVYVSEGTSSFTMNNGKISGNTATQSGGGVYVYTGASFTMSGGEISGNTATQSGGGVYLYSGISFTMSGGVISGNTAGSSGGGLYNGGTFRIVTGTIYGSNETGKDDDGKDLKNTSTVNAALSGTGAQRGTFTGGVWTQKGVALAATDNTINVLDGEIVLP